LDFLLKTVGGQLPLWALFAECCAAHIFKQREESGPSLQARSNMAQIPKAAIQRQQLQLLALDDLS